ncbi:bifunctional folylpolyglutamate synthase/dihydrofolate synthase [Tunturibacter empetritectus]|uniref:Dihydrofolate synthase/folylpolyglutamate synthase n=1 Tax=Tunturiibacter empetritectus TaxID=3069691 RepID=A0A7W8MSB3_9BACT|nr:folylpolyglutamate synthase/dihydrofolate synthase family protein [Edaphobacter lichenicola]MBB5318508.1 dihydrofolate synthase/folylpolyglutamate synthase [Edaphobacter lichenicola]
MSYTAAVDHLYALGQELAPSTPSTPRRKFDLAHMRVLAAALGNPQTAFPSILIAGTNGKGSTAATLSSIFTAAGYRTGLYTSPHLVRVNERIQIDGQQIPDEDFARLYFQVDETARHLVEAGDLPYPPSFFEVLTAVGFLYFAGESATHAEKTPVDIAVLEVGLGGRLDATNIVDPLLSILTDIALDHQDYLGNTIAEITREKAGILRPNGTLITLPQHPEANQAIGEAAATLNLRAINAAAYIPTNVPGQTAGVPRHPGTAGQEAGPLPANHYILTLDGETLEVDSPLSGHHQQRNIALAIAAAAELRNYKGYKLSEIRQISNQNGYKITNTHIETGIRNTHWPGRLELFTFPEGPQLLLDVAHNPAGAWTLRAAIAQLPEAQPRTLLFSCLRDKDLKEMGQILFPLFDASSTDPERRKDHIVFAPIDNPRAAHIEDLLAAAHALDIPAHAAPHLAAALAQARALTPSEGLIIATGSVYLVGEIRRLAGEL